MRRGSKAIRHSKLTAVHRAVEALEARQLFAVGLLPDIAPSVPMGNPQVQYDFGTASYNSATQDFQASAELIYVEMANGDLHFILPTGIPEQAVMSLDIGIDSSGDLILGSATPTNLQLIGAIDLDDDFVVDPNEPQGLLLAGEILALGFDFSVPGQNGYFMNFRFTPTGGLLASNFAGRDIGMSMILDNRSFAAPPSFASLGGFTRGIQGLVGSVPELASPSIDLVKLTNGTDNNQPTGPSIPVGSTVTWSYVVTNTGNVPLSNVIVVDDNGTTGTSDDFTVGTIPSLAPGGSTTLTATGVALAGQYTNIATATGIGAGQSVTDSDLDHYIGTRVNIGRPAIGLVKLTNGTDNDIAPGLLVPTGSVVTWTYSVTNTGDVPLGTITLTDDQGVVPVRVSGDADNDEVLDLDETWIYIASGVAQTGEYTNLGTVTGRDSSGTTVTSSNPDNYFGAAPDISLVKLTNGTNNNTPTGPVVPVGSTVSFTYEVRNLGNVALSGLTVIDDNGTSGNTSDDFAAMYASGDTDGDTLLDLSEVWIYTASGTAVAGQHANLGKVTAQSPVGSVTSQDIDHHFGQLPGGTIRGNKYLDLSGNGLSADDTGLGGVKIYLDADNDGKLDSGELWTTTAANGAYQFTDLAAGTYVVREVIPSDYVRTAPALSDKYVVTLSAGQEASGFNFANFKKDCNCDGAITCITYVINGCEIVTDLRGNVSQGDEVKVRFTVVGSQSRTVSLVSYKAPSGVWDAGVASQQTIYDLATGTFGPGTHTLTIEVPNCYFQVDFVCGLAIDKLGPVGSNIFYSAQGRLLSADNGGTRSSFANGATISGKVFRDYDRDGRIDTNDTGILGVVIKLTGVDSQGRSVSLTRTTAADGTYSFGDLRKGTYTITEVQPTGYKDGADIVGTVDGLKDGRLVSNDKIGGITLDFGDDAIGYNFAEIKI